MTDPRMRRVKEIFLSACDLPIEQREQHLRECCGEDNDLFAAVEALFEHERRAEPQFLAGTPGGRPDDTPTGAPANPANDLDEPSVCIGENVGRYRLLKRIGAGGFGEVYVAEQTEPVRRQVALKVIKLGMDTRQVIARFEAERQALALMDHPGIAKVFDAGATATGRPYFVMELVRGVPITDYCDRENLDIRARLELFVQVCRAIQHAHEKGVIHRDVKPSNVLITTTDAAPVPKVIDFGIAKSTDAPLTDKTVLTEQRQMIGTPAYMSPEQARLTGGGVDTRSDVYSLGVILYELLTGATPVATTELREAGLAELQRVIRDVDPPKPSTRIGTLRSVRSPDDVAPGQPPAEGRDGEPETIEQIARRRATDPHSLQRRLRGDLDWIVMKALEKDPVRRYPSAGEMAADIQRHLHQQPVLAGPPGAAYRFRKYARRHRLGLSAGAAVAVFATGFFGLLLRDAFTGGARGFGPISTLAVLPLENPSGDAAQEYFADGITESLIHQMERLDSVRVIAVQSVMQYKGTDRRPEEIAADLKADAVIKGSVSRLGSMARLEARLYHADAGRLLWSGSYDRKLEDMPALQNEVARAIAREIRVTLTPRDDALLAAQAPIIAAEASDAYLRGRFHWNKRTRQGIEKALELFEEAIRIAPDYVLAHAGMADAYILLTPYGDIPARESYPRAQTAARKALSIDAGLGPAYASLAVIEHEYEWNPAEAERHFLRAIELSPNYATARQWYAEFLTRMGRHEAAIEQIELARQLDPLSLIINSVAGWVYHYAGQPDRAIQQLQDTLDMEPGFVPAHGYLGMALEQQGEYAHALQSYQRAYDLSGGSPRYVSDMAVVWAKSGDRPRAEAALATLLALGEANQVHAFLVARAYTALGQADPALQWLEKGCQQRGVWMLFVKVDPLFDSIRRHPHFESVLRRVGFEP